MTWPTRSYGSIPTQPLRKRKEWKEKRAREYEQFRHYFFSSVRLMDPQKDLETLGVPKDATKEQINARYRELVKTLHPDANDGSAAKIDMFIRVTDAMERLRELGRA